MNNTHNQSIPQAELDEIKQSIEKALSLLKPYTIPLTPAERSNMAKLVDKTNAYSLANPQLCPSYFNQAEFAIDFNDYQNLRPLVVMVEQLLHQIEDTMTMAGSEAYIASLSFYNSAKDAAKRDIPGAKAVYEDLRLRFPQPYARKKEEDKK